MQNPNDGSMEMLEGLDDPKRKGKEHWPIYKVGDRVKFNGWWWEVTAIDEDGLKLKAVKRTAKFMLTDEKRTEALRQALDKQRDGR